MSDYGDFCREQRRFKQVARLNWVECPSASCYFGGNPVKVAPGDTCRHCGWEAPGNTGDDIRKAREIIAAETKPVRLKMNTCRTCGRKFKTEQGRAAHERDVHQSPTPRDKMVNGQ